MSTTMYNNETLLSKSAAAALLGIGKTNLAKLIGSGKIKYIELDRRIKIPYQEIKRFLSDNLAASTQKTNNEHLAKSRKIVSENEFDTRNMLKRLLMEN
jgi:excisionase family DNA binding protein